MDNQNPTPTNVTPVEKPLDITEQPTSLEPLNTPVSEVKPVENIPTPVSGVKPVVNEVLPTPPVSEKSGGNGKNKVLFIVIAVVIVLLVTIGAIIAYLLLNNSNSANNASNNTSNTDTNNSNDTDVENDDTDVDSDNASDQLPDSDENVDDVCEVNNYTTADYPDFNFDYDCNWELVEDEVTEVTDDIFTDGVAYNKHQITLRKDNSELFFTINKVIWEGYPSCANDEFEILSPTLTRIDSGARMGNTLYSYIGRVDLPGSSDYEETLDIWYPEDVEEFAYCGLITIPFGTESSVVSESDTGIPLGQAFNMIVNVELAIDNSDDMTEVLEMADLVVLSMEN